MSDLVLCEHLGKSYGRRTALSKIDLHLPAGRIIGLLGPNGSGKTTLLKILAGLLTADSGYAKICDTAIGTKTKTLVSYLPDRMYYADWMKIRDLIDLFADFYADFRRDRAIAMCKALSIGLNVKIKEMSKGGKEKLQLILVMSRDAKLYLLDEPIGGVDPAAREFILQTILTNYSPESSVLISTHLVADVEAVLDDVIFLYNGQILRHDSADNIRSEEGCSIDETFRKLFRTVTIGGVWPC